MAKKKMMLGNVCPTCPPNWFGILVLLVGILFILKDLGYDYTGGITIWPAVIALIGLHMWLCK
jgi:hypothetical protein